MEDSLTNENKIHWPGLVRSRLAELEASEGDHMSGLSVRTDDWSMAVDTLAVVGSHAVSVARLHRLHI